MDINNDYNIGMKSNRVLFLILLATLVLLAGIAFERFAPRLEEMYPLSGASGLPGLVPVRLTFSRPMQEESVLEHLTISPQVEGQFSWKDNTLVFTPIQPWPAGTIVTLTLSSGSSSMQGLPLWGDIQWNFSISQVLLAYLHPFGESADLYTLDLETGQKDKVTQSGWVVGYDVILSGMRLYFSILNAEGGSSLMEYDRLAEESSLLLDCGADLCSDPRVSFDESWLAFERMPKNGVPHIWIYDLKTGVSNQVSRSGNHAQSPKWSSQGVLSFYDFDQQAYVLYSPSESEQNLISNQTGASIAWSPEGTEIIIPELFPVSLDVLRGPTGEASLEEVPVEELEPVQVFTSHLIKTVIASGVVADLTQDNTLEDASPVYSPDGTWIAFGRRSIDEQDWIPGRQLWLMRSNGEDAHMLTNSPDYKYTAFAWHPDGSRIAYVRANQTDLTALVELWVIKTDGSDPTRLVIGGYAPQWIP